MADKQSRSSLEYRFLRSLGDPKAEWVAQLEHADVTETTKLIILLGGLHHLSMVDFTSRSGRYDLFEGEECLSDPVQARLVGVSDDPVSGLGDFPRSFSLRGGVPDEPETPVSDAGNERDGERLARIRDALERSRELGNRAQKRIDSLKQRRS
jgi:hypothetical protein